MADQTVRVKMSIQDAFDIYADDTDGSLHVVAEAAGVDYMDVIEWLVSQPTEPEVAASVGGEG